MTWKKFFTAVDNSGLPLNVTGQQRRDGTGDAGFGMDTHGGWLPAVYAGSPNRLMRYRQYDAMDTDPEISAALDTIAEFATQDDEYSGIPFEIDYDEDPSDTESKLTMKVLKNWCNINDWRKRLFRMFRSTIKYGDCFMIRDPETYKLYWVDPAQVEKIIVNQAEGKSIDYIFVRNLDPNFEHLIATRISPVHNVGQGGLGGGAYGTADAYTSNGVGNAAMSSVAVGGENFVHPTMSDGMGPDWPFGNSILDPIYKIYRQKELLEDAVLIYRLHRAPERRVFFIDVGNMPAHQARQYLEQVKYEVKQKRIPNQTADGKSIADSAYNPMSMLEDYFFAQTAEGRGSKVDTLPGGDNLGDIDDLKYFNNKLLRGLGIPSSYLPTGPEDGSAVYNDGKVGVAYIQEYRFSKYVERLQRLIEEVLDKEFKMYLKWRGVEVDNGNFRIKLTPPQNFGDYRDIQLNSERAGLYSQVAGITYMSNQFKLKKYLGLTEEEMRENEELWRQENDIDQYGDVSTKQAQLRNVGVRPQQDIDVSTDIAEPPPSENPEAGADLGGLGGGLGDAGGDMGGGAGGPVTMPS